MEKLLSVVIPVFNVEDYLSKTIDCVLEQTYKNWELILVDDGSSDKSLEIARNYSERDKRVKVYQRKDDPKGAPSCRNLGFNLAKGEYLIYLDSDDIIAPYCFQQRVRYIEKNDCDFAVFPMIGFNNELFDADGMIFGYKPYGDVVYSLLARTLPFVVVSNIYRRISLVEKGIRWDVCLKSFQDSDYNLQAIRSGLTYKISNLLPDYFYRLSAQNSICKKLTKKSNCESQIRFLEKQFDIYGNNKRYRRAIDICAAQIFRNVLLSEEREQTTEVFVASKLFQNRAFLRKRIRMVARITSNKMNYWQVSLIQFFFLPKFFLDFRWEFYKWGRNCNKSYRELGDVYIEKVPLQIQKNVQTKI